MDFADRKAFEALLEKNQSASKKLIDSLCFGEQHQKRDSHCDYWTTNAGNPPLLNALLEDKAIISSIAGTTRDSIEDEITIQGIGFRFIDTAGIRDTKDEIEQIGIQKTFEKAEQAAMVLYLVDSKQFEKLEKKSSRN